MHDLLLVDPDAEQLAQACGTVPCRITPATRLAEARAFLAGHRYACVVVSAAQAGWLDDLRGLIGQLGGATELIPLHGADPAVLSDLIREIGANGTGTTHQDPRARPAPSPALDPAAVLQPIRDEMSHVVHALNNPLAVISGNAQLGAEIARSLGSDASLVDAFVEIEAAARQLEALFADVTRLRLRIEEALREGGREG